MFLYNEVAMYIFFHRGIGFMNAKLTCIEYNDNSTTDIVTICPLNSRKN